MMTNEEKILQILKDHPKWYQKIPLPGGQATSERDRSGIADLIFPLDLRGASILDVGCAEGFFCAEAKRRNAGKVIGVDIDSDRLDVARKLAGVLNLDIEYHQMSVMNVDILGAFDYVLCLNVLHHVSDPIHLIHKLANMARERLVLEIADLHRKRVKMGGLWMRLISLLPSSMRPGILAIGSHGAFFPTRRWIEDFFRKQHYEFDQLKFNDSDRPRRYVAIASARKLDALEIISGPTNVGKSELIHRLQSGDEEMARLFKLNLRDGWCVTKALDLEEGKASGVRKLLLHYDLRRIITRGFRNYEFDPALTLMRGAALKRVSILVCSPDALAARVHEAAKTRRPTSRRMERAERVVAEYSQPGWLRRLYESWISYCNAHACEIRFLDVRSRQVREITKEEAFGLVG